MNWMLRKLGFKVHKWEDTHLSGCSIRCAICGERQDEYMLWVYGEMPSWWETTESGDGSCSDTSERATRIY